MNKAQQQLIAEYSDNEDWAEACGVAESMVINMLLERPKSDEMLLVRVLEKQMDYIGQALAREIMVNKRKLFNWSKKKQLRELEDFRWTIQLLQWHAFRHTLEQSEPDPADG